MRKQIRTALALALVAALAAGCAAARHIREAQREFDAGAAIDLAAATGAADLAGSAAPEGAAAIHYHAAAELAAREIAENGADLVADKLLGTARMLGVLANWRLSDLRNQETLRGTVAADAAALAAQADVVALGTRDRVVLAAMPGLLDHDRGLRAAQWRDASGTGGADALFSSAYDALGKALETVKPPAAHGVRVWVHLARLNVCKAWQVRAFELNPAQQATMDAYVRDTIKPRWKDAAKALWAVAKDRPGARELLIARGRAFGVDVVEDGIVPAEGASSGSGHGDSGWTPWPAGVPVPAEWAGSGMLKGDLAAR